MLEGVVRTVEPAAFLKVSALGVEEKRVNVIADFRGEIENRQALGDGYRIEARIVIDEATDVITVPEGALFRHEREWHVFRIRDGLAELQPVVVGKSNGITSEITDGLPPSDLIILHPTDKITNGTRVNPTLVDN